MGTGQGSARREVSFVCCLPCSYSPSPAHLGCSLVCPQDHIRCCRGGGMGSFLITSSCLVAYTILVLLEPGGPSILVPPLAQEAFRSACGSSLALDHCSLYVFTKALRKSKIQTTLKTAGIVSCY